MATAKNDISKMELILKSHPEYAEIDLPELFKGSFVSWLIEEKQLKFNNTKEALDILIKELDGYLDPQEVYYSDNPNSDIKQYI